MLKNVLMNTTASKLPLTLAIAALTRGEGGSDDIDWSDESQRSEALKKAIEEAVTKEVGGLKSKNEELLSKLAKAKEGSKDNAELAKLLESLGGEEGVKSLAAMKTALEKDERTKKLLSGDITQIEEVINSQTTAMKKNYENQIAKLQEQLEGELGKVNSLTGRLHDGKLRELVDKACSSLECLKGVSDDVFREAKSVFSFNEDGQPIIIDDSDVVRLGADGRTPMSVEEWLDSTRETSPYRWADSRGSGAGGSGGQGGRNLQTDGMSMADYRRERSAGNIK